MGRFEIWLDPFNQEFYEREYQGSRQLVQGIYGMGYGGLSGIGIGKGYPQYVFAAEADSITAFIGEEIGLIGLSGILILFALLVVHSIKVSLQINNTYGKLLGTGLSFLIAWQVFVTVGGVLRVIPMTGLALPFIAAGGSSLITNWIIIGILLRLSDFALRPRRKRAISKEVKDEIAKNSLQKDLPSDLKQQKYQPKNMQQVEYQGGKSN